MVFVPLRFVKRLAPSADLVQAALREYVAEEQRMACPLAPDTRLWSSKDSIGRNHDWTVISQGSTLSVLEEFVKLSKEVTLISDSRPSAII